MYDNSNYYHSSVIFRELIPIIESLEQSTLSCFYQAYCNFHKKNYLLSSYYFEKFSKIYFNSKKIKESIYMNSYAFYLYSYNLLNDRFYINNSMDLFINYLNKYPNSFYSNKIINFLLNINNNIFVNFYNNAKNYYYLSNYNSAFVYFKILKKEFIVNDFLMEKILYLLIDAYYNFSNNSNELKKGFFFLKVIRYSQYFFLKYPNSIYSKSIEIIYSNSLYKIKKWIKNGKRN